ncbi:MAG: nicotinate-nucleotide--dimethylbenzimidazole phosphoribosyltransferase [Lachnospiraceae bacterium]|nr:nicotinate-nucleotide--dimethylbenzimidazole phosphoribosyltransferase [Lachnospiraceae bacterium]
MDTKIYEEIKRRWDSLAKPIDGLGDFEDVICKIGAIQGTVNPDISRKALIIMCADNGIVSEGVSQCGKEVTMQVAKALGCGRSTANVMAKEAGIDCVPIDIGIDSKEEIPGVINRKVRRGSNNFLHSKALKIEEVDKAINVGIDTVKDLAHKGYQLILTGEMGIGNTTTSTALLCLMTGLDPASITGRGAGLDDAGLDRKIEVIRKACLLYKKTKTDDISGITYNYLSSLGGLDIAGLCGVFLGGERYGIPIVIDGFISAVAAYVADTISPGCRDYMIPSHSGREKGLIRVLDKLSLKPLMAGDMALGEGTGGIMTCKLIDSAMSLYNNGMRFDDNGIKEYERFV